MSCDYCGRTNSHDGHGGCYSCGAPLKYDDVFSHDYYADSSAAPYVSALACTAVAYVSPKLRNR